MHALPVFFRSVWIAFFCLTAFAAKGQNLPQEITPSEVSGLTGETVLIKGAFPGLIYIPRNTPTVSDNEYQQNYRAACGVYMAERTGDEVARYARRFIVYVPDAETLPFAKRVCRTLSLLHALTFQKMRQDHFRAASTVEVWLMRQGGGLSAEAGGRQFKNQIYLFNILTERSGTEWLREVAHEYGHYILPGISGFKAPEEWGNGVLGERLFLQWIWDALRDSRLKPEEIPFVTPEALETYVRRRVEPLVRRISLEGANAAAIKSVEAEGMDYFTGLAIYIDAVYETRILKDAFAYTESSDGSVFIKAPDFLRGIARSLASVQTITFTPPLHKPDILVDNFMVYLPRGEFLASMEGSLKRWELPESDASIVSKSQTALYVSKAGWRRLKFHFTEPNGKTPCLMLRRRGSEANR